MISAFSALHFAGSNKRQKIEHESPAIQSPSRYSAQPDDIFDTIVVQPHRLNDDVFESQPTREESPSNETAVLPAVGDVRNSRSNGNLRRQANLLSEKELKRDLEQHTAYKTYHALDLILDIDHPLEADKKSKNPGKDRYNALRALRSKVDQPAHRLTASDKRYLSSVGLIDQHGNMTQATRYDVAQILTVSPLGQQISLLTPKRSEAKTYWQAPRQNW